ncbi:hypothetical protein NO2_0170 [Candidatus Termititenax persephonae]|uniref:Glycosyltransferase RgtA/B/C/D-like domain-containing protein n=1 Tax=Candidatus Termititenax persephonae TaxID=2218525 RepID=A0A388TEP5_9BACT|nr:hypothetical protein NO2_0170 [Candidatus Termititenax persephonae]
MRVGIYAGNNLSLSLYKKCFAITWLVGCFLLIFPSRIFIIKYVEVLFLHRMLEMPWLWHGLLISCGLGGVLIFILLQFLTILFKDRISSKANKLALLVFGVIQILIVCLILYKANWVFGDDHMFISTTAIGKYFGLDSLSGGRFYPLGHFHFNLLVWIANILKIKNAISVVPHFILIVFFYLLTASGLYLLFREICGDRLNLIAVFFAAVFPLLVSAFQVVFMELIYPESIVIPLLIFLLYLLYKGQITDKTKYYIGAGIVAVYVLYCKEPISGSFLVVALTNLIFCFKEQTTKERVFHFLLLINTVLYLGLYYFLVFRDTTSFYNVGRVNFDTAFFLPFFNPIYIMGFILALARVFYVLVRNDKAHLYYDSFLFAGVAYLFAYILLRLNGDYYLLPAVILFLPSLVYWTKYLYVKKRNIALLWLILLILICGLNYRWVVKGVINILQERRTFVPYVRGLCGLHEKREFIWYESDKTLDDNKFSQVVRDYQKYVFNVFLNYVMVDKAMDDFFLVTRDISFLSRNDIVFFYSNQNNQGSPMPINYLAEQGFELYADLYGVQIYAQE